MVKNGEKIQEIIQKLTKAGWINKTIGKYRTQEKGAQIIRDISGFKVFIRTTQNDALLQNASQANSAKAFTTGLSGMGSNPPMGIPEESVTPCCVSDEKLCVSGFENYPSLMVARPNKPCVLIGYDSEWEDINGNREMLSWQFAVIQNNILYEFAFLRVGEENLKIDVALSYILNYIGIQSVSVRQIRRYSYCTEWTRRGKPVVKVTDNINEARNKAVYAYINGEFTREKITELKKEEKGRRWKAFRTFLDYKAVQSTKVTLLCHSGLCDISAFDDSERILKHLTEVQGGLVSLHSIRINPKSLTNVSNTRIYPISLTVADTMCHAPVGKKKLKDLGAAIKVAKID